MGSSWIILVLLGVGWAVQAIAQAVAKKQEQERLRQVAEERRRAAQRQSGRSSSTTQTQPEARASSAQLSNRPTSREELAARRQAQLEELRRRRMAQSRGQSTQTQTQTRASTQQQAQRPSPPTRQPQPTPVQRRNTSTAAAPPQQRPSLQEEIVPRRAQRPSERLKEKDDFGGRLAELRRKQAEVDALAARQKKRGRRLRDKPIDEQRLVAPQPLASAGAAVDTASLFARLRNPQAMRELFVLKELLDPPVSLRDEARPGSIAL